MGNANLSNFLNATFKVKERITKEQAWENIKRDVELNCDRGDGMFKSFISTASLAKNRILYAPVYHAFVKGKYSWKSTEVENVGNAFIGNIFLTTERTNSVENDSHYIIDKNDVADGGKLILDMYSYQKNFSNAVIDITVDEAFKLPLLTPFLTDKVVFAELAKRISREHKGKFDPSNLMIALVLVPILEVEYIFMSQKYIFYVDMYSGKTDTFDVPTSANIVDTAKKLEKINKISNIIKLCIMGISVLALIVETIKCLCKADNLMGGMIFFLIINSLLIFVPKKYLDRTASKIANTYDYSDEYITDKGWLSFKSLIYVGVQILQLLLCLIITVFDVGFMFN